MASWRQRARYLMSLRVLPPRVARFMWRAHCHATRTSDAFSLISAIRPRELAALLSVAHGRETIVELGTGTAWSTVSLALDDDARRVVSYDPCVRNQRDAYLALVGRAVRDRIELRNRPDTDGPSDGQLADLLFIDSGHDRDSVLAAFGAWRNGLAAGAIVAFHDYRHPDYPGIREAILELHLAGVEANGLFIWHAPP